LTVVNSGGVEEFERYVGRTLGDMAKEEGKNPTELMIDLARKTRLQIEFRSARNMNAPEHTPRTGGPEAPRS
jgi:hypothetical protein